MTMDKPDVSKFRCWFPLQEASGSRFDAINHYELSDYNTVLQGTGHAGAKAADFERSNSEDLYQVDTAWQDVGDIDLTVGAIIKPESNNDAGCIIAKGARYATSTFALFCQGSRFNFMAGVSGSTSWDTANPAQTPSGKVVAGTVYFVIGKHKASTNKLYVEVYNTSGALHAEDATPPTATWGTNNSSAALVVGCCGDGVGGAYSGSDVGGYFDGLIEQVFIYDGFMSDDEVAWIVNGGTGRQYSDLVVGGVQIWYSKMRDWFARDGSLHNERIIEELWKRNQRLRGLPEALPV